MTTTPSDVPTLMMPHSYQTKVSLEGGHMRISQIDETGNDCLVWLNNHQVLALAAFIEKNVKEGSL